MQSLSQLMETPLDASRGRKAFVYVVFLVVNLASVIAFNRFIHPQGYEYGDIALSLLQGTGYSGNFTGGSFGATSFMAPFYPGVIYLSFRVFGVGKWWPIQILQILLLSLVPLMVLRIRRQLYPDRPRLSWGVLLLPAVLPFTMYCGYIGPAVFLAVLITGGFSLLLESAERKSWPSILMLGAAAGIAGLIDPIPLVFFAVGFLWLFVRWRGRGVLRWFAGGLIALAFLAPWLYRNYREFRAFPLLKCVFGWNLWEGNNPLATGGIHSPDGGDLTAPMDLLSVAEKDSLRQWNEWQRDRFFMRKAVGSIRGWLRTDPFGYLKLKLRSLLSFWFGDAWNIGLQKTLVMRGANPKIAAFFALTLVPSFLLLALGIVGVVVGLGLRETRPAAILILVTVILWAGTYTITHGHTFNRYRAPLDPVLVLFALSGLGWLIGRICGLVQSPSSPVKVSNRPGSL